MTSSLCSFLIYLLLLTTLANSSGIEKPKIEGIEQIDETTIRITWSFGDHDHLKVRLDRYRIFFVNNNHDQNIYEWPAQLEAENNEARLSAANNYFSFRTKSELDCHNNCIRNPNCEFVLFSRSKCLMKSSYLDNVESDSRELENCPDCKYYRLKEYTNEATLTNFPANGKYTFFLAVYSSELDEWSSNSNYFEYIGQSIEIDLTCQKAQDKLIINWEQLGAFYNYQISRYSVKVSINRSNDHDSININQNVEKYNFFPYNYNAQSVKIVKAKDEPECYEQALSTKNCIHYMFEEKASTCYLLTGLNRQRSSIANIITPSYGIKTNVKSYEISDIEQDSIYQVQLEFIDSYGLVGFSNKALCQESIKLNKILRNRNLLENENYATETDYDYQSYLDSSPSTTAPAPEDNTVKLTLNAKPSIAKQVNENLIVTCSVNRDEKLAWTRQRDVRDQSRHKLKTELVSYANYTHLSLLFDKLSKKNEGVYVCSLVSNSSVKASFNLSVTSIPSRPEITSVKIVDDKTTLIGWNLEDDGGLESKRLVVLWSKNFKNSSLPVRMKSIGSAAQNLRNNLIEIDKVIPLNYEIKISIENDNGPSEFSDVFIPDPNHQDPEQKEPEQSSSAEQPERPNKEEIKAPDVNIYIVNATVVGNMTVIRWSLPGIDEIDVKDVYLMWQQNRKDSTDEFFSGMSQQEIRLNLHLPLLTSVKLVIVDDNDKSYYSKEFSIVCCSSQEFSNDPKRVAKKSLFDGYGRIFIIALVVVALLIIAYILYRIWKGKKSKKKKNNEDDAKNQEALLKK